MAVYLVDNKFGKNGLNLASLDSEAQIVLIQDGVYIDCSQIGDKTRLFAVVDDVKKRGLLEQINKDITLISYNQLADMILKNKLVNFL